jgi:hypothetical protein
VQEIPDWFASLDDHNPAYNNRGGGNYRQRSYGGAGGYGGSGGYGGGHGQQRFGGRDVRGDQQTYTYTESYGGYNGAGYQAQGAGYGQPQHQQGYQQRGGYAGGRGGGGYGGGAAYGQQGYQQRNAHGQDAYGRRPQQPQYGGQAGYGQNGYGSAAQYGSAAPNGAYGAPAAPSPQSSNYYDAYNGAYAPASPAGGAPQTSADTTYAAVDAMVGQFAGMAMQQQQQPGAAPTYGAPAAAGMQGGAYGQRPAPNGMQHGMQPSPQQRPAAYSRPHDPAAGYMSQQSADPYAGYPPQAPQQHAQYPAYQQKPTTTYAQAPAGYGQQQQHAPAYGQQQRGPQVGYGQQPQSYANQQASRYSQQPPSQGYGVPQQYQQQGQYDPQQGGYDAQYLGGTGEGADGSDAAVGHASS